MSDGEYSFAHVISYRSLPPEAIMTLEREALAAASATTKKSLPAALLPSAS